MAGGDNINPGSPKEYLKRGSKSSPYKERQVSHMLSLEAVRLLVDCEFFKNACNDTSLITPNEAFEAILNYEGLIHYDNWIKRVVKAVYNVDLDERKEA